MDENVGLLREGYDLSMKGIANELKKYDIAPGTPYPQFKKNAKQQFEWKPGASNPHSAIFVRYSNKMFNF